MEGQQQLFKVRDRRKEHRFYTDNEFLNGYAKRVGWRGQSVYMALCRHAKDESCFPSREHLAVELGIGIKSIDKGIKLLKDFNIISVEKRTRTTQGRASNYYYLLDRTEWKVVSNWSNQSKADKPFRNIPHRP